jgi:hypothetical protein
MCGVEAEWYMGATATDDAEKATYSAKQSSELCRNCWNVANDLQQLAMDGMSCANTLQPGKARQHMTQGVGRRLAALRRSLIKIFELYPPSRGQPLPREALEDIQIYLQAFVINLYGIFDNWAWAFVYRHDLLTQIGGRMNVSLFKDSTRQYLPAPLREYLAGEVISAWHDDYLKGYRDALAHRIPLYLPPAAWTKADAEKYEELEREKMECLQTRQWEKLEEVWAEQDVIGKACPTFMHEFTDEVSDRPVFLHPQIINDSAAVVEFGKLFLNHWHERTAIAAR